MWVNYSWWVAFIERLLNSHHNINASNRRFGQCNHKSNTGSLTKKVKGKFSSWKMKQKGQDKGYRLLANPKKGWKSVCPVEESATQAEDKKIVVKTEASHQSWELT